ncbi:MAG TPA: hypothetical protein ENG74_04055 [Thermoplasmatales archaeon]|nr:hypothetical protein [Thermoplasmatales archaeon]
MQLEKNGIAAIAVIVCIIGASAFLYIKYYSPEDKIIRAGDCVLVNYIGKYASNGTIFDTSYESVAKENGIYDANRSYEPLKIFVDPDGTRYPPEGYEDFSSGYIEGLLKGLVGLKEGEKATIGPIPPEEAYGLYPEVGTYINLSYMGTFKIVGIEKNQPVPEAYVSTYGNKSTTIFKMRDENLKVGDTITFYLPWENATVITKINETKVWLYTTPPEDKRENFTWVEVDEKSGNITYFWENATSIEMMNESVIVLNHHPELNATMRILSMAGSVEYKVVNITNQKIIVERTEGNTSYQKSFNATTIVERNQSRDIIYDVPEEYLAEIFRYMRIFDPTFKYSLDKLAGESLIFEVEIVKLYKTSKMSE